MLPRNPFFLSFFILYEHACLKIKKKEKNKRKKERRKKLDK